MSGAANFRDLPHVNVGLLGADYEIDNASSNDRFKKIYGGENWDAQTRSPLTEPGVNVKRGLLSGCDQRPGAARSANPGRVVG